MVKVPEETGQVDQSGPYFPENENEAWFFIMYGCLSHKGFISGFARCSLKNEVVYRGMFSDLHFWVFLELTKNEWTVAGSWDLIDRSAALVSKENRHTLFAICVDLVLRNCLLTYRDVEIIEYLASVFDLNQDVSLHVLREIFELKQHYHQNS